MKPVNPASEDDSKRSPLPGTSDNQSDADLPELSDLDDIQLSSLADSPLERLKLRYAKQLTKDIERLEANKAALQTEVDELRSERDRLETLPGLSVNRLSAPSSTNLQTILPNRSSVEPTYLESKNQPRLPGETAASIPIAQRPETPLELPIPATSEQRRQNAIQIQQANADIEAETLRRGLLLSAIATLLIAWHYVAIATLGQGGSWLGLRIAQVGTGFVPAVALLWLRMLVTVPALVFLAPQLHKDTWEDLQALFYTRDRVVLLLLGSGLALFLSQAFIYQSISLIGAPIGTALLFLYPLTLIPLGAVFFQDNKVTQVGLLAIVAIAMGGLLTARPAFLPALESGIDTGLPSATSLSTAVWLGILASVCFSFYIAGTNAIYRQRCHPIPTAIVQFSVMAVLSSFILLVRPLELADISWFSFATWGIVLGSAMLLVYLLSYGSLRLIGARTSAIAAAVPLVTLAIAWGFSPRPSLEIIQWTGILLVSVGGIALGSEKASSSAQAIKKDRR